MKNTPLLLTALTCASALLLPACGDAETDADLPAGQSPSTTDTSSDIDPHTAADTEVNPEVNAEAGNNDSGDTVVAYDPEFGAPIPRLIEPDDALDNQPADSEEDSALAVGDRGVEEAGDDAPDRQTIPGMSYVLPEGWTVGPARQMRLLTLLPPDAAQGTELSVFRFPGNVGGFGSNVTRWAGQIGVQFVAPPRIEDYPAIEVAGTQAVWIPLINEDSGQAILAIWLERGQGTDAHETWTYKFSCTAAEAVTHEAAMRTWAESIELDD